jgi:hypothetical protein
MPVSQGQVVEHDESWMKEFIQKRTDETWSLSRRPYYLSFIATDMTKAGVNYKPIIEPLKLRQWATTRDIPDTKLVVHPVHRAKVGFVPKQQDFNFETDKPPIPTPPSERVTPQSGGSSRDRYRLLQFFDLLSKLDDEELGEIQIPVKTIVRLLKG